MINITKLYPDICKYNSCLKRAVYKFINTKQKDTLVEILTKTKATIGYSCEHHVEEVNKLLKEIYEDNVDKQDRKTMIESLMKVGLYKKLLDSLKDEKINALYELIGWAAPVFEKPKLTEEAEA
tara:strand:- start:164 stop:535 length:372 start_codon:yes stop_codon:yes gene_type:complete